MVVEGIRGYVNLHKGYPYVDFRAGLVHHSEAVVLELKGDLEMHCGSVCHAPCKSTDLMH